MDTTHSDLHHLLQVDIATLGLIDYALRNQCAALTEKTASPAGKSHLHHNHNQDLVLLRELTERHRLVQTAIEHWKCPA